MTLGPKALSPETPYVVYEFGYGPRVFYVGISYHKTRIHGRWSFVESLIKRQAANASKPVRGLKNKNHAVIALLVAAKMPKFEVHCPWHGLGRIAALEQEKLKIQQRLTEGCLLANRQHAPDGWTAEQIVKWLVNK